MLQEINTDTWHRKEIFDFFCGFDEPYFGITADVHVSKANQCAKEKDISFFVYYLHCTLIAINQIDALKLRILETKPVIFDTIHASATINRPDGSFGFSFINFEEDLQVFNANFQQEADRIRTSTNLFPDRNGQDCVHLSALPWIKFTALSHARHFSIKDGIPKISFGKMTEINNEKVMPCSVHAHHGLADGRDIGLFFEALQQALDR